MPQKYIWDVPVTIPFRPTRVVLDSREDGEKFLKHETVQAMWQEFDGESWNTFFEGGFRFEKYKSSDSSETRSKECR